MQFFQLLCANYYCKKSGCPRIFNLQKEWLHGYISKENCMVFHGMDNKRQIFENYNNLDVFSNL